jgi:spermidine synthase
MIVLVYTLFFLSGAAALVYQVVWVRSFGLVFGGSHLAVTTVLSVFMGGLALGSWLVGRKVDQGARSLRFYGLLELGIAASALAYVGLMKAYPYLYVPLARTVGENPVALTAIRVSFATAAIIVPTTLMGGTLPVLVKFATAGSARLSRQLSFLYAFNTLGAVAGTLAGAFTLLELFGASGTLSVAIAINLVIGLLATLLPERALLPSESRKTVGPPGSRHRPGPTSKASKAADEFVPTGAYRMVLWGIGVSGFCALGYEVLWTRILSLVIGTSVYGFATMLTAFLAGIAAGSQVYGLVGRTGPRTRPLAGSVLAFAAVQVVIGVAALAVTVAIRDLPTHATTFRRFFLGATGVMWEARQITNSVVAFSYMFLPAFFMGIAFPLAGTIHEAYRRRVGAAVGEVLSYNTIGAILGASFSGFALIYAFGIERSLQILAAVNIGLGVCVAASLAKARWALPAAFTGALGVLLALSLLPDWGRIWNRKYFAIFRNNQEEVFDTPYRIQNALDNTDVLFFHEGINETISVIRPKGANQAVIVNGKVVASTTRQDRQCQYTLGHLPMLLHPDPKRVFVLGLGTGMTLGAVSVHPEVQQVVLAELEPAVVPAARTFARFNHDVLDDPKLRIVFADGRNHLLTTRERFDVITADPIHPWTRGAAYLYTEEYFELAADRLTPGGVMCQWLPIYELTPEDIATVVRTFQQAFAHSVLWLTQYDAELVGSNAPIAIDEERLAQRLQVPAVAADLAMVEMGSVDDFLSYFVAGTKGLRDFANIGVVNTDDNLRLEFSAPRSVAVGSLMGKNVLALTRHRENIADYLTLLPDTEQEASRRARWNRYAQAARIYDKAHAQFLSGRSASDDFRTALGTLTASFPEYAPVRFLKGEHRALESGEPRLLASEVFALLAPNDSPRHVEISAVEVRIGTSRGTVIFVDNAAREVYGQHYQDGSSGELDAGLPAFARQVLARLREVYEAEAASAVSRGRPLPPAEATLDRLRAVVVAEIAASS